MKPLVPVSEDLRSMLRMLQETGGHFETPEMEALYDKLIHDNMEQAGDIALDAKRRHDIIKEKADKVLAYLKMVNEDIRARMSKQAQQMPVNGKGKFSFRAKRFSAHLRTNKGRVEVFDPENCPRIYLKRIVEERPDLELLRAGIEAKEPGAMACARIVDEGEKTIVLVEDKAAMLELEVEQEIRAALE